MQAEKKSQVRTRQPKWKETRREKTKNLNKSIGVYIYTYCGCLVVLYRALHAYFTCGQNILYRRIIVA